MEYEIRLIIYFTLKFIKCKMGNTISDSDFLYSTEIGYSENEYIDYNLLYRRWTFSSNNMNIKPENYTRILSILCRHAHDDFIWRYLTIQKCPNILEHPYYHNHNLTIAFESLFKRKMFNVLGLMFEKFNYVPLFLLNLYRSLMFNYEIVPFQIGLQICNNVSFNGWIIDPELKKYYNI
jgi:hypothetical protein